MHRLIHTMHTAGRMYRHCDTWLSDEIPSVEKTFEFWLRQKKLQIITHQVTNQVRSHLDPDNPAPVDDLEGCQTLVQKEPHPCAVNLLQMLLSVRVFVMFIHSVETNKDIFNFFSPFGSQAILVFQYQTAWQYSNGNSCNGGIECRWGRQKSWFSANTWLLRMLWTLQQWAAINAIVGR